MLRALLIIIFVGIYCIALAQAPYLYFNRLTTQNGLSHNKVNCIIQDKRGFIWIGTDDGLNRYDGQYFTIFRHDQQNTSSVSGNIITGLLEDKKGILWITTADGGLSSYDYRLPAKLQFKSFKHIEGDSTSIPVNVLNGLIEDNYGYLWLASGGASVLRFNKVTEKFTRPVARGTQTILAMCLDDKGTIWAGKQGGSFLKINSATLKYEMDERYKNLYATLPHVTVTAIHKDENYIWFGSWDNVLYRYNLISQKEEVFQKDNKLFSFPNDEIRSFALDKKERLWMGGNFYGLTIYDKRKNQFYNYRYNPAQEGTIADNRVNCVYIDRFDNVWLATNKGVNIYNPAQQAFEQTFLPQPHKDVIIYDFYKDEEDNLWIGTDAGIFIQRNNTGNFELRKISYKGEQLAVTKFFKDDDGKFYIGTNYSFFIYDAQTNSLTLLPNTQKDPVVGKIIKSRITSVVKTIIDGHPALLVTPYGHFLAYYDLVEKRWISRTDSVKKIITSYNLKDNLIRKIYKSPDDNLWLATGKFGLGIWQNKVKPVVNYLNNDPSENSISSNDVYDITADKKGNLWISTYGGGLNYFNRSTQQFEHITASNNLLEGIATDTSGNVWMISNGNLHKYNITTRAYTSFNLPDLEKSGGVRGNIYKDKEGNMYAAGINYFIKFNPLQVNEVRAEPGVFFTDFKIFNKSYAELLTQKNISLKYNQNYFTIEFSAPQFTGNDVEYFYKLNDIDKEWNEAGSRNFANYSNLPGGEYVFNVRAGSYKGKPGKSIVSLNIVIIPPFWERWWFYTLCAVTIIAAIYSLYRYRLNEVLKREAIRNKIAQDLHDNLGSTLSSISVYSQVAKIYQQQQKTDQLQQTLSKIGDTSGEMINEMSDIVWAINPKNDHMSTIIQRMESYTKPLLQAKNIAFSFNYDPSVTELNLHMEKRKNFYLVFKEAVNNALKYSNCKTLQVSIHQHNHKIELTVRDDGAGFDVSKIDSITSGSLSGNGLNNMKNRAQELKAVYKLESSPGKGTTVFLAIPIP